jgi:hypothetical protein
MEEISSRSFGVSINKYRALFLRQRGGSIYIIGVRLRLARAGTMPEVEGRKPVGSNRRIKIIYYNINK